jgi:6,7-dimethyl-8-ribityllumazine synthase
VSSGRLVGAAGTEVDMFAAAGAIARKLVKAQIREIWVCDGVVVIGFGIRGELFDLILKSLIG